MAHQVSRSRGNSTKSKETKTCRGPVKRAARDASMAHQVSRSRGNSTKSKETTTCRGPVKQTAERWCYCGSEFSCVVGGRERGLHCCGGGGSRSGVVELNGETIAGGDGSNLSAVVVVRTHESIA
ncbi:hypothetical protein NL676_019562 [Syzygium grande]|nr:hypothetical protein NL676_019562 [Syzygium grande]